MHAGSTGAHAHAEEQPLDYLSVSFRMFALQNKVNRQDNEGGPVIEVWVAQRC